MTKRRFLCVATALALLLLPAAGQVSQRLTDQEFWKISTDASEPGGTFHSENLVSNEIRFQGIIPDLIRAAVPGKAYIGVGSEQNFTYIAAVRPAIAFIVDIRRENRDLHLLYKAFFEMSADRAEFIGRLFSLARPAGLTELSTVAATKNVLLPVGTDYSPPNRWLTAITRDWSSRYVWPKFIPAIPREFFDAWCAEGPTHHVALGVGHEVSRVRKVADLLGLELAVVD